MAFPKISIFKKVRYDLLIDHALGNFSGFMALSYAHRMLSVHRDIFSHLDEVFSHVDGVFGPKNTFLAVLALTAAALTAAQQSVNYRDFLKEMHQEWSWLGWDSTPSAGALSKACAHLEVEKNKL